MGKSVLWLNSDGDPESWLHKVKNLPNKGSLVLDHSLHTMITKGNDCLSIEVDKDDIGDNPKAKITSCYEKATFFCIRELSPSRRTKFPCIPRKSHIREKRSSHDGEISTIKGIGKGKS